MHRDFDDLKTNDMNAKEYLKSKGWMYDHIGKSKVDGVSVTELMEEYAEMKIKNHGVIGDVISIWKLFCLGLGYLTFTILAMYYIFGGSISIEINMIESWQLVKAWFSY